MSILSILQQNSSSPTFSLCYATYQPCIVFLFITPIDSFTLPFSYSLLLLYLN